MTVLMNTHPMPPVLGRRLDPASVARAIRLCEVHNSSHHIPLFQAAGAGRITMTALADRLSRPNLNALNRERRPALILIGDDEGCTTGPLGWAATGQVLRWARGAFIHGSGGDRRSYMMAVRMAEDLGRVALIETESSATEVWRAACQAVDVPAVIMLPSNGEVHPIPSEGEATP